MSARFISGCCFPRTHPHTAHTRTAALRIYSCFSCFSLFPSKFIIYVCVCVCERWCSVLCTLNISSKQNCDFCMEIGYARQFMFGLRLWNIYNLPINIAVTKSNSFIHEISAARRKMIGPSRTRGVNANSFLVMVVRGKPQEWLPCRAIAFRAGLATISSFSVCVCRKRQKRIYRGEHPSMNKCASNPRTPHICSLQINRNFSSHIQMDVVVQKKWKKYCSFVFNFIHVMQ